MMMKARLLFAAAALLAAYAHTAHAAPDAATRAEIDHLLNKVGQSECRFNRNGSWHDAKDARTHLQKKLDYMARRELLKDTEGFITHAASKSSMSGKAYQIQCPGSAPVASSAWFTEELKRYREGKR
jgi:hypothetical protein